MPLISTPVEIRLTGSFSFSFLQFPISIIGRSYYVYLDRHKLVYIFEQQQLLSRIWRSMTMYGLTPNINSVYVCIWLYISRTSPISLFWMPPF